MAYFVMSPLNFNILNDCFWMDLACTSDRQLMLRVHRMPALSWRCTGTHRGSAGRRRISPEGGNRGMLRGSQDRPHGYGDLNHPSLA